MWVIYKSFLLKFVNHTVAKEEFLNQQKEKNTDYCSTLINENKNQNSSNFTERVNLRSKEHSHKQITLPFTFQSNFLILKQVLGAQSTAAETGGVDKGCGTVPVLLEYLLQVSESKPKKIWLI